MFKIIEKEKVQITCPLCRTSINEVWVCKLDSVIGVRYTYFCSKCQKMLGISKEREISNLSNGVKKFEVNKSVLT